MHHPWILAMHILRDYILLVIITSPGSLGSECRKACLVMWCPDVQDPDINRYIKYSLEDPDAPPGEEQKPADDNPVPSGQPTAHEEETVGLRVPWVGYYSEDCRKKDRSNAPDGKLCLVTPKRHKLGTGHGCYWGICKNGRCVNAVYSRCATM
ncbi:uncharacterized protein [Dermacentor albipictus]|uniref:uncharacterized protein isoform X3 n=1 Tax=Dermacentor albipictus TaxID=60249 RepID=UPI0038FBF649